MATTTNITAPEEEGGWAKKIAGIGCVAFAAGIAFIFCGGMGFGLWKRYGGENAAEDAIAEAEVSEDGTDPLVTPDESVVEVTDGIPVEDEAGPLATVQETWDEYAPSMPTMPWEDDGTSDDAVATTEPDATELPTFVGVTADGNSFLAPNETGTDVATAEVVLGEVDGSARSAGGRSETYWVQGTHQDPMTNARLDRNGHVVDPDDIRRVVGIRTTWTAIPGNTDVVVKCIKVHGEDDEVPADCSPSHIASR